MREVKQLRALATRKRIIHEASRLFTIKGYDGTKLEEVLRGAKTSMGAFFHHFESKEDLGFAVLADNLEDRGRQLDRRERQRPPTGDDPLDLVFRRLDAYREMARISQGKRGGCVFGNLSAALSDTDEGFRRRLADSFDTMAREFHVRIEAAAKELGSTCRVDSWALARYIVSVIQGSILLARTYRDPLILEKHYAFLKEYVKQVLEGA